MPTCLLGGSRVVINRAISTITILITHIRGLLTHMRGRITHIRGLITPRIATP